MQNTASNKFPSSKKVTFIATKSLNPGKRLYSLLTE